MRDAANQALQAGQTAQTTGAAYNSTAAGIGANLMPFLTRQMTNPQGMSQRDVGAQLTAGLAGAGGATAGLTGAANKMAAATRNPMGFSAALDAAARERARAGAGTAERVAANNADVKLRQQQEAAQGLGGLYGTAGRLGVESQGQTAEDVNAAARANSTGWLQNLTQLMQAGGKAAGGLGAMGLKF